MKGDQMRCHATLESDSGPFATGERGFSFMELMVVSVLVLVLAYLVITLGRTGVNAQDYSVRMNRVTEIAQEVTETIREDVLSSVRVYHSSTFSGPY